MSERLSTSAAARLLQDRLEAQEEPLERPWCRLSEASALVRLQYPTLKFRGITSRMRPLVDGQPLSEALELPGLGWVWVGEGVWYLLKFLPPFDGAVSVTDQQGRVRVLASLEETASWLAWLAQADEGVVTL